MILGADRVRKTRLHFPSKQTRPGRAISYLPRLASRFPRSRSCASRAGNAEEAHAARLPLWNRRSTGATTLRLSPPIASSPRSARSRAHRQSVGESHAILSEWRRLLCHRRPATMAAMNRSLARSNKSGGRAGATKRHGGKLSLHPLDAA
jgi:hypothetical protein